MPTKHNLASFVFTSLMAALTAILFLFAKMSPLKDGVIYFALMGMESLLILEFGFKLAAEYYIVSSILAWLILQIPFCLGYIIIVGTWPLVKFFLQLKLAKLDTHIPLLLVKSICFLIYTFITLGGLLYFSQLALAQLMVKMTNLQFIANSSSLTLLLIIVILVCLTAHIVDHILDSFIYYYLQHWQKQLHKALKLG